MAKFDPTGTKIIYSTYLGGDQRDYLAGIAVDSEGNAYIAGTTGPAYSTASPPSSSGGGNAFVKKLNPTGSALLYTRYIGGDTGANGIAVDSKGNATIAGYSFGPDFPGVHPLPVQPTVKSLYVTNDGGLTWRLLNHGLTATYINSLAIDPTSPSTLYAATSSGLYKSTDAGANWTQLLPSATVGYTVTIDPTRSSTVYVTYTTAGSGPYMFLARSNDGGATWTDLSANFPPSFPAPEPIGAFAIDPAHSNVLWAILIHYTTSAAVMSTDSGNHWQVAYTFPPGLSSDPLAGEKLLIDPKNSSRIYACCVDDPFTPGSGAINRSDDGGKSWIQLPFGIVAPWIDPHNSNTLYGEGYGGLEKSTDAGMTWSVVPLPGGTSSSPSTLQALAVDANGALRVLTTLGYLLNSSDGGVTWTKVNGQSAPEASILAIDPTNPSTIYIGSGVFLGPVRPAEHAFAAKLDDLGTIQWATLLGGSRRDVAQAVALDPAGNAYVTGITTSDDFPTVNPFQAVRGGYTATNAFVSKISADGSSLMYSSFLGGTGMDSANAIAVDAAGNAYVAGKTSGGGFPVVAPPNPQPVNPASASFVAKVNQGGSRLVYSTLLTGSAGYPVADQANTIGVDAQGRATIAGITGDFTLPLINPMQLDAGLGTNFITTISASGSSLDFSTYLGELHTDIESLAIGSNGSLWIAGDSGLARIDFQTPEAQPGVPQVFNVYNAASFHPGDTVAPGEIVTLIGQELAPGAQAAGSGSLPTNMQGVSVSMGGVNAPLFYVSPGQINFQVPVEIPLGSGSLAVQRGTQMSTMQTVSIVPSAPGLFVKNPGVVDTPAIVHASDFSYVAEQNPAYPGEYLAAFCTGLGTTNPAAISGQPATAAAPITAYIYAALDSEAQQVLYAGLAPGFIGLYQINFRLSESETPGLKRVVFEVGSGLTNLGPIWVH